MKWHTRYLGLLAMVIAFLGVVPNALAQNNVALYGGGTYNPGDTITLNYYIPASSQAEVTLYRLRDPEQVLSMGGPRYFENSEDLSLERLRRIPVRTSANTTYDTLELGTLPAGMYFAQINYGQASSATLILVTDLSMVVKTDQDTVLTYTAASSDGSPRRAHVFLMDGSNLYAEGLADDQGLTEFATPDLPEDVFVATRYGDAWAFSGAYWSRWNVDASKVYIHSDRPVYRPGQEVFFKGTARTADDLVPLADREVQAVVRDADGTEILQQTLMTDAYGSFAGSLLLASEPPLGYYNIEVRLAGSSYYGGFEVLEYQKPEYRVTVTADDNTNIQGDTATATIAAEYLFGGAVAGGDVTYAVLKQPYYRFRYRSSFGFYEEYDYSGFYGGFYDSEVIERGEGVLDAEGNLVLEIPLPEDSQDYQITVQAGVTDEARREITSSGSLIAYRAGIVMAVDTNRYAVNEGEDVTVTVRAETLQGEPVSVPFELTAVRSFWIRSVGRQQDAPIVARGRTDVDGLATLTVAYDTAGSYTLTATASDSAGRQTDASDNLWVSGGNWYWAYGSLSVEADKPEYQVGDVARFVVQSPIEDGWLLISREGRDLHDYELIRLVGSAHTYELPITRDMAPNGFISAVVIGDGQMYTQTAGFRVPPVEDFLDITLVSDQDTYQPGDTGTFNVQVQNAAGEGVRAQVALGLVDEAIYLIRPENAPDIRGYFYALRSNVVGTESSDWYYFGQASPLASRAMAAPEAMDAAVFGQAKSDFAEADLREDFRDTIVWLPFFETDDSGTGTISVDFPDNLTEWRLTARAITLDDDVGQNTASVVSTLPVIARLAAPPYLVRGDEASLRVIGQSNLEDSQTAQLELSTENLVTTGNTTYQRQLPAGGRVTAEVNVQATNTGDASVTAIALTSAASDAMRIPLPVLPRGVRDGIAWASRGSDAWTFTLPTTTDTNTSRAQVVLTPSFQAAVAPALAYLAGYPYGCTEQTMSRFLPSVLARQAGASAQLPEEIAANLDDFVASGLKRLYDFQQDDGGWGFWQFDDSNVFITSYVVSGLLDASEAGYVVRDWVLEGALDYLRNNLEQPQSLEPDAAAYAYYALARAGDDISDLAGIFSTTDMTAYGMSLASLAMIEAGNTTEAEVYLDVLLADLTERDQVAYWDSAAPRYFWNDDRVEATAYGLQALYRLRPEDARIAKIVNWLLLERRGSRWFSTKDTAAVVQAALLMTENDAAEQQVTVRLNGEVAQTFTLNGESVTLELTELVAGQNRLEIDNTGAAYVSANVEFFAEGDLQASNDGIAIDRQYSKLVPTTNDAGELVYERTPVGMLEVGDYVLATVTLKPEDAYRYVLVNEPLPAGLRVIENDQAFVLEGQTRRDDFFGWYYPYNGRDIRDERIDFYFTRLADTLTFTYIMRAETPGQFTALPSQAWLMYDPSVRGHSSAEVLQVQSDANGVAMR